MTRLANEKPEEEKPTTVVRGGRWFLGSELSIVIAFLFLAILMTWPWVLQLRDAVPDTGDPYLASWILWWVLPDISRSTESLPGADLLSL